MADSAWDKFVKASEQAGETAKDIGKKAVSVGKTAAGVALNPLTLPLSYQLVKEAPFETFDLARKGAAEATDLALGGVKGAHDTLFEPPASARARQEYRKDGGVVPTNAWERMTDYIFNLDKKYDWGDVPGHFIYNLPGNAAHVGIETAESLWNISDTIDSLFGLVKGTGQELGKLSRRGAPQEVQDKFAQDIIKRYGGDFSKYPKAVIDEIEENYGSWEGFKKRLAEEPVEAVMDLTILPSLVKAPLKAVGTLKDAATDYGTARTIDKSIDDTIKTTDSRISELEEIQGGYEKTLEELQNRKNEALQRKEESGHSSFDDEINREIQFIDSRLDYFSNRKRVLDLELEDLKTSRGQMKPSDGSEAKSIETGLIEDIFKGSPNRYRGWIQNLSNKGLGKLAHVINNGIQEALGVTSGAGFGALKGAFEAGRASPVIGRGSTQGRALKAGMKDKKTIDEIAEELRTEFKTIEKELLEQNLPGNDEIIKNLKTVFAIDGDLASTIQALDKVARGKEITIPTEMRGGALTGDITAQTMASSAERILDRAKKNLETDDFDIMEGREASPGSLSIDKLIEETLPAARGTRMSEVFPQDIVRGAGGVGAAGATMLVDPIVSPLGFTAFSPKIAGHYAHALGKYTPNVDQITRGATNLGRFGYVAENLDDMEKRVEVNDKLNEIRKRYGIPEKPTPLNQMRFPRGYTEPLDPVGSAVDSVASRFARNLTYSKPPTLRSFTEPENIQGYTPEQINQQRQMLQDEELNNAFLEAMKKHNLGVQNDTRQPLTPLNMTPGSPVPPMPERLAPEQAYEEWKNNKNRANGVVRDNLWDNLKYYLQEKVF